GPPGAARIAIVSFLVTPIACRLRAYRAWLPRSEPRRLGSSPRAGATSRAHLTGDNHDRPSIDADVPRGPPPGNRTRPNGSRAYPPDYPDAVPLAQGPPPA